MKNCLYLFIVSVLLCSACAYNQGQLTSHFTPSPNQKYEYVDIAVGFSKSNYFFGLGGFNKTLLYNNAKRNLFFSYPLKPNETIENITTDKKIRRIGPFKTIELIAIGDVVKHSEAISVQYSEAYSNLLYNKKANTKRYIALNETVLILKSKNSLTKAKVIKHNFNYDYITVFFITENGHFKTKKIGHNKVFKIENMTELKKTNGLDIADSVYFERAIEINVTKNQSGELAEIIGLNDMDALLKTKIGFERFSLFKIKKTSKK